MSGTTTSAESVAAAIQAVADAVGATATDPGDGIRLLLQLAAAAPPANASALGLATAARCRRAALIAACGQSAQWQPTSADDAQAMIALMTTALDAEITTAGDAGDDATYGALIALRAAVINDLSVRGASLAPLTSVTLPGITNTLSLAARLYQDATREGELERRIDPPHPLFVGGTVVVLAR